MTINEINERLAGGGFEALTRDGEYVIVDRLYKIGRTAYVDVYSYSTQSDKTIRPRELKRVANEDLVR